MESLGSSWGRSDGVAVARVQSLCLLERLAHLGPGARAAAERRRVVEVAEQRRGREAQAFHLAHANRGLRRVRRAFEM